MRRFNTFTRPFAKALFDAFPWLREHATADEGHGRADAGSLFVEYWPPPRRPQCALRVSTDNAEVTLGFASWHAHYEWPPESDGLFAGNPLEDLGALVADRLLVMDAFAGERWLGCDTLEPGDDPDLSRIDLSTNPEIRIWSFSGKHDRVVRRGHVSKGST